jgi:hypothetical protein
MEKDDGEIVAESRRWDVGDVGSGGSKNLRI